MGNRRAQRASASHRFNYVRLTRVLDFITTGFELAVADRRAAIDAATVFEKFGASQDDFEIKYARISEQYRREVKKNYKIDIPKAISIDMLQNNTDWLTACYEAIRVEFSSIINNEPLEAFNHPPEILELADELTDPIDEWIIDDQGDLDPFTRLNELAIFLAWACNETFDNLYEDHADQGRLNAISEMGLDVDVTASIPNSITAGLEEAQHQLAVGVLKSTIPQRNSKLLGQSKLNRVINAVGEQLLELAESIPLPSEDIFALEEVFFAQPKGCPFADSNNLKGIRCAHTPNNQPGL